MFRKAENIMVNNSSQWIFWRGNKNAKTIILFLHGGPGTPETLFLDEFCSNLYLHFLVASWEQRSAGRSFDPKTADSATMTLEQFVSDGLTVAQKIQDQHPGKNILLVGHSWGTLLGVHMATESPELFAGYVGVSQVSNSTCEEKTIYEWVVSQAKERGNKKALNDMRRIGSPINGQHEGKLKSQAIKLKWVNKFGGGLFHDRRQMKRVVKAFVMNRSYRIRDKFNYFRAESFALEYLFETIATIDLHKTHTEFKIPVVLCSGRHDYQVPLSCSKVYFKKINAPHKQFIVFEKSAHGTLIEEPELFLKTLIELERML